MAVVFLFFTLGVGIFFVTRTWGDVSSFFSVFYQQFDDSMHLSLTGPILDLPPYTPVLEVRRLRTQSIPIQLLSLRCQPEKGEEEQEEEQLVISEKATLKCTLARRASSGRLWQWPGRCSSGPGSTARWANSWATGAARATCAPLFYALLLNCSLDYWFT